MPFSEDKPEPVIRKITFNGQTGGSEVAWPWIMALNEPRIVIEKAGFLFKAAVRTDHLLLTVTPAMINGERSYHYDQKLDGEDAYTLIGNISAAGLFTILFKPTNLPLTQEQKARYIRICVVFSWWLLREGYSGKGLLNKVTQSLFEEIGLSPTPQTLADLSIRGLGLP